MINLDNPVILFIYESLYFYIPEAVLYYYIATAVFGVKQNSIKTKLALFAVILVILWILRSQGVLGRANLVEGMSVLEQIWAAFRFGLTRTNYGGHLIVICIAIKKVYGLLTKNRYKGELL